MKDFDSQTLLAFCKRTRLVVVSLLIGLGFAFTIGETLAQDRDGAKISLLMVTGMPGGTCYQVGLGMASLWTTKLREAGIRVSAAHSEGSRENIEAIRISDADLILAEQFLCSMAFHGSGIYKGQSLPELRSITNLWPDVTHLLIHPDMLESGTIQDLQGLTLATGPSDSGNKYTTQMLLKSIKNMRRPVNLRFMSNMAAAEAFRRGTVQALDLTGGAPIPLITTLCTEPGPNLRFLDITASQLEAFRASGWEHMFRYVVAPGTYPGQERPINTMAQMNVLAVTSTLNSEVVYALTKTLYENLDYLARVHPACRGMSLKNAITGLNTPLHRGAIRYYREQGLEIPAHLIK